MWAKITFGGQLAKGKGNWELVISNWTQDTFLLRKATS
jgi:hypothetical protein